MFRTSSAVTQSNLLSFYQLTKRVIGPACLGAVLICFTTETNSFAQKPVEKNDATNEVLAEDVERETERFQTPASAVTTKKGTADTEPLQPQQRKRLQPKKLRAIHHHRHDTTMADFFHLVMTACPVLFFLWLGAAVGSFLNVVIYRMPAGLNLSKPKSRCPKCMSSIRFRHNVPMLGWLMLRGKCYDCQEPISFRYPVIEAIVAIVFGGLLYWEVVLAGAHIPEWTIPKTTGLLRLITSPHARELLGWYLWHSSLLTLLLAMGMIHYDNEKIPAKLMTFALVCGFGFPLFFPELYPLPVSIPGLSWLAERQWAVFHWNQIFRSMPPERTFVLLFEGPVSGVVGTVCGGVLFGGLGRLLIKTKRSNAETVSAKTNANIARMGIVVGCFLGWQAVTTIAVLMGFTTICCLFTARQNILRGFGIALFLLTGFHLVWWREIDLFLSGEGVLSERFASLMIPAGFFFLVVAGLICFLRYVQTSVQAEETLLASESNRPE